mmetsp:Transcript_14289/g.23761  ORF Transcript_14289/g.23761 Transcript_14289/m.23761 type:complete len:375 (-) Transcript_14289:393-1517(-)
MISFSIARIVALFVAMQLSQQVVAFRGLLQPRSLKIASQLSSSYLDELNVFKSEKKVLVGLTTDAWQVGTKKYKEFLSVNRMAKKIQKNNLACVEVPMWEITQGPHFDELQRLLETFWIPDLTTKDNMIMKYDLIVVPDPVIAKYLVEAFYVKEDNVQKRTDYYKKLIKQPWGDVEAHPPEQRLDYQRYMNLGKQKWIRKYPPLATLGEDTYKRLKHHAQIEYFSYGVEDFALHIPKNAVPTKRVLVLRYKNRYDTLVQSLVMKGINVTSAYPITWGKKEWNAQEERMAKEVDVIYFHEIHAVHEWKDRLGTRNGEVVVVCHDEEVAKVAKELGFQDIFFSKKGDSQSLTKTMMEAVDFAKSPERLNTKMRARS